MLEELNGKLIDGLKFCSKVYSIFEKLRLTEDGSETIPLREMSSGKQIIEELLPICRYIQTYYRVGRYISVKWIKGNQPYDAKVVQKGDYIELGYYPKNAFLEVTSAMHKNEHWTWELSPTFAPEGIKKNKDGARVCEPVTFTNFEHVNNFIPIVVNCIEKKAKKDYPENTSLIVQCFLNSLYHNDEWEYLIHKVREQIKHHPFKEILIYNGLDQKTATI